MKRVSIKRKCFLTILFIIGIFCFSACTIFGNAEENLKTDKDLADIEVADYEFFNSHANSLYEKEYKMNANVSDRSIVKNWQGKDYKYGRYWNEELSDKEYSHLYNALSVDTWLKRTDLPVENYVEPVINIYSEPRNDILNDIDLQTNVELFTEINLYVDDIAFINTTKIINKQGKFDDSETISSIGYQMPAGTFDMIHHHLVEFKENKRQEMGNAPVLLKELLAYEYRVSWNITYDELKFYQGEEYYENRYICLGTKSMAKEILAAFGDVSTWEVLPPGDYSGGYKDVMRHFFYISGEPCYINIYKAKKGGTYIEVPEYLVFYAADDNIIPRILKILENYRDQWRIFLDEE